MNEDQECPICSYISSAKIYSNATSQDYWFCTNCYLIWLDASYFLNAENESARYQLHNNSINESGYVNFLENAIRPTLPFISTKNIGLDFGCGPSPVLAQILKQKNIPCYYYDPFFFPDMPEINTFDFIFATECFEHFYHPKKTIDKIISLLSQNGILTIMTEMWLDKSHFSNWYYTKDPTHVCFFHQKTFDFLAQLYHLQYLYNNQKRILIFKKTE